MKDNVVNFGFGPILQTGLPEVPWDNAQRRRLPGIEPLNQSDWLRQDEAFEAQLALRDHLWREIPDRISAVTPGAEPAVQELLDLILVELRGYEIRSDEVVRPDGVSVSLSNPVEALVRLVAEDLCLLQSNGDEHVLTGAMLAFPSGWTLSQKIGKALIRIHQPVEHYDPGVAKRVQRLFDAIKPGRGLVRLNALRHEDAELFHPQDEDNPMLPNEGTEANFIRSERQCLLRLPKTRAVVFSIHTRIVPISALTKEQARTLAEHPISGQFR